MATARSTPLGTHLDDGYSTKIAFNADPDVSIWEKTVTPPGMEGGDPIDITTMHNDTYRTFAPRSLITLTDVTFTGAYDPRVYDAIIALINVEGEITVHFSDSSTLDFFGFLRSFTPASVSEGAQPEATVIITPTNVDSGTGNESAPDWISPTGSP